MRRRNVIIVLGLALLSLLLWNTPILYPLKLLVVLMHETGHALAAILTGGRVERIEINALQGGITYTAGGSRFLILSAGYLGSSLFGALILWSASHRTLGRYTAEAFGLLIVLEALLWVRDLFTFGFALGMGGFCMLLGWRIRGAFEQIFMQLVGTVSCLYAIYDIFDDVLRRFVRGAPGDTLKNDAQALADITLIPALLWGILWSIVAIGIFTMMLRRLPDAGAALDVRAQGSDV